MPGDFARPTGGRKPIKKKVVRKTTAPVSDVQSSGEDYGTKKAVRFKQTKRYGTAISKAAVAGVKMDQTRKAARDAKAGKSFNPRLVRRAISLGLTDAKDLKVGSSGRIEKRDLQLDAKRGGPLMPEHMSDRDFARATEKSGLDAAGQKIIDQTLRPSRAVMGVADELVKGHGLKGAVHGFTEGLIENKPYSAGKILKRAGVPKEIAGPVGFVADVAADPTTYATFGAGSVAKRAAVNAEKKTLKKATRAGMTEAGAKAVARRAGEAAAVGSSTGKGLTLKFAGKEVPAVRRVTAKAGRGVSKAAARTPEKVKTAAGGAKKLVSDVRPQIRQAGVGEAEHVAVRRAGARARAEGAQGMAEATRRARAARRLIPAKEYERVIDAIERGKIGSLPKELRQPAQDLRDSLRYMKRLRKRTGIGAGDVTKAAGREGAAKNYFPHALADELEAGRGVHEAPPLVARKGVRKVRLGSEKKRKDLRPIREQNLERLAAGETPFSANLPLVYGNYMADTSRAVAAKNLAAGLHAAGRPFKDGVTLHPDDVVFHYHNGDLTPLKEMPKTTRPKAGQYVVLNRTVVEREFANIAPQFDRTHVGALFDKGTAAFKRIATFTPGFHARNLVGDTWMGYLAVPGRKVPGNLKAAGRAVRRIGGIEKAQERTLGRIPADTRTLKIRRTPKNTVKVAGKPMHVDEFVASAKRQGVVRSGYISRELREQGHGVGRGFKRVGGKITVTGHALNRWMQNREDFVRLATYKHGLDRGMTAEQAADLARNMHIDYGDLTKFERTVGRRAAPFYTFSARALPIHAKALVQRPGKFAQFGKLQQEAALATGLDFEEERGNLKTYQARQIPLILNINGEKTVVSDSLPMILLNELPAGTDPGKYLNELAQWIGQLANPILKDPVELYANRSFFFRNDIQPKDYPLVSAPGWVKVLHDHAPGLAASLGITPDYIDRKSGKKTWGWYGKADYVFKTIPGIPLFAQKLTQEGNRRGQSEAQQWLSFLGGVRAEPLDPEAALTEVLFQEHDDLEGEIGALRQRERTTANARKAAKLRARQRAVERQIYELSRKRGDAIPLYRPSGGGGGPSVGGGLTGGLSSGLGG